MNAPTEAFYEFGPFRVDARKRLLLRDCKVVPLTPKAFELLLALVESGGRVIEKDELMNKIWADTAVEESNLAHHISVLRKALGESRDEHHYIVTVPGRGYSFVASVSHLKSEGVELIVAKHTRSQVVIQEETAGLEGGAETQQTVEWRATIRKLSDALSQIPMTRTLVVSMMLGGLAIAAFYLLAPTKPKTEQPTLPVRSIVVLPFKPLAADRRDESFELGIADTLITKLSTLKQVTIRPISSVRKYSALDQDPIAAGREQKVDAVLEGSIQWDGPRIRVAARLLSVADGSTLWSDRCEEQCTDIFALQNSISQALAKTLALQLTGEERRELVKRFTDNDEAYRAYMRGRYLWNKRTIDGLKKSISFFNEAIQKDPSFALAYVGLSDAYIVLNSFDQLPMNESHPKAKEAAEKAIEIDDKLADAHTSLATIIADYVWDWPAAEKEYLRAIELNRNYPTIHHWYSEYLAGMGKFDQALAEAKLAHDLDPVTPIISADLALIYYWARQPDQAIERLHKTLEMDPDFGYAHEYLARAYEMKGMTNEAVVEYLKAAMLDGESPAKVASLKAAYATSGWNAFWRKRLALQQAQATLGFVSPISTAAIYARLGENVRALDLLQRAIQERSVPPLYVKLDPRFDGLRSESRFHDLLRIAGVSL
jgi:DNA-binding winged helix-turn-helix (wHTH) protein/TolB-like protein